MSQFHSHPPIDADYIAAVARVLVQIEIEDISQQEIVNLSRACSNDPGHKEKKTAFADLVSLVDNIVREEIQHKTPSESILQDDEMENFCLRPMTGVPLDSFLARWEALSDMPTATLADGDWFKLRGRDYCSCPGYSCTERPVGDYEAWVAFRCRTYLATNPGRDDPMFNRRLHLKVRSWWKRERKLGLNDLRTIEMEVEHRLQVTEAANIWIKHLKLNMDPCEAVVDIEHIVSGMRGQESAAFGALFDVVNGWEMFAQPTSKEYSDWPKPFWYVTLAALRAGWTAERLRAELASRFVNQDSESESPTGVPLVPGVRRTVDTALLLRQTAYSRIRLGLVNFAKSSKKRLRDSSAATGRSMSPVKALVSRASMSSLRRSQSTKSLQGFPDLSPRHSYESSRPTSSSSPKGRSGSPVKKLRKMASGLWSLGGH